MAHAFSLYDGTTTISLSTSGIMIGRPGYQMATPESGDETVVDTVDIIVTGASGAAVQTAVRAIDAMLDRAIRRRTQRVGPRVYVQAQLDSDTGGAWRSELLDGRFELTDETLAVWANKQAQGTLYLERRPYWEGPEAPLPLTNSNGSWNGSDATGLAVYNCNDGSGTSPTKQNNYIQIAAADVGGSMPAPVKIEIKNAYTGSASWWHFYLANNAFSDPANLTTIIEGEASTSGGTDNADADSSGDYSLRFAAYSTTSATWSLPAATLQKTAGRWFRLLARLDYRASVSVLETMEASIWNSGGNYALYRGPKVKINGIAGTAPFIDLGVFPLPPGGYDVSWDALRLQIDLAIASGTTTTDLDFIQITPLDSYRVLELKPESIAVGGLVMDNGIDGIAYIEVSAVRYPFVQPVGEPLMVFPGKLQRIYILADSPSNMPIPAHKWTVRAWYRPRRLTL